MRTAMSTAVCHLAAAPSIDASSIFQPCGMNMPNRTLSTSRVSTTGFVFVMTPNLARATSGHDA